MKFLKLNEIESMETNGGGLTGAFIGGIFGTAAGMVVGVGVASVLVVNGQSDEAFHAIQKCTTKGALTGIVTGMKSPL